jgi:hypothetical protein
MAKSIAVSDGRVNQPVAFRDPTPQHYGRFRRPGFYPDSLSYGASGNGLGMGQFHNLIQFAIYLAAEQNKEGSCRRNSKIFATTTELTVYGC